MKQTKYTIEIPEGHEVKIEGREIKFIPIEKKVVPKKLPKSWEELKKVSGVSIDSGSTIEVLNVMTHPINKDAFRTTEQAEAAIALAQLSQLRQVYRDSYEKGWESDWTTSKRKYCISYISDRLTISYYAETATFLSFPTEELAVEFLNNFEDLIEKALPLMS